MKYSSDIKGIAPNGQITINNCGELRVREDSHIRRYCGRGDYQLIYICEGQCVVTLDGGLNIAHAGDCILYRPGEVQDYSYAKNVHPRAYWIHFNGESCHTMFDTLALQDVHIISAGKNREIEHLISRICRHYNLKTQNHEWICAGLMQSVLAFLSNEVHKESRPFGGAGADKISELVSYIKITPNLNITVAQCAAFCNLSIPHFSRVFKKTTGASPIQFMLHLRIERARELLDFTDKSVADIAEGCGFRDQNYFARAFKKCVGVSPMQYRKKQRN